MKRKKVLIKVIAAVIILLAAFGYYYIQLPAFNIHSKGFWHFIIFLMMIVCVAVFVTNMNASGSKSGASGHNGNWNIKVDMRGMFGNLLFKIPVIITGVLIVIYLGALLFSSPVFTASKYQKLLSVEQRNFSEDIEEVSYDQIPLLDKDSASIIGTRVMGTMVDMVSQYEVSDRYSQINYKERPVRVSPLQYGNLIKWFANYKKGIPAYIRIDMATQRAECVRLEEGIKYSQSDHFGRNIYRHLRFAYPTYMFDNIHFEIDENGTPYWVCPVKKYNIGLFGGQTIGRVVLCNAITGEMTDYKVEDVPKWVDKVYSAELLIELYDYHGTLKHGFINSVLSQKDCLQTTDGYNYIALDDDVWVYTGITSVGQDESNVGFVLMNQRTMETRYYEIPGAEEFSAMKSAEGRVQNLGYEATFPLLINISGQPTYFMALKDDAGLVKCYSMLNIEKYQNVAIGDSILQCEANYIQLLKDNHVISGPEPTVPEGKRMSGTIQKITPVVVNGNTHMYILLNESEMLFDVNAAELVDIVRYDIGQQITFKYVDGEINTVTQLEE